MTMMLRQINFLLAGILLATVSLAAPDRDPPLHHAAKKGDVAALEQLLEQGADINEPGRFGATALHRVVVRALRLDIQKRLRTIDFLIDHGADVNARDSFGFTPLYSGLSKDVEVAIRLINAGAEVNTPSSSGVTPLVNMLADSNPTQADFSDLLAKMVASGLDINASTVGGTTPLHMAARRLPYLVSILIDADANPNATNDQGETPLHLVSALYVKNFPDMPKAIEALIEAGADVNAADKKGNTPLTKATETGARVLLAHSASVDPELGEPPLHVAAFRGDVEAVKSMLAAGADPDRRWQGSNAMDRATAGLLHYYGSYKRAKSSPRGWYYTDVMAQLEAAGGASLDDKVVQVVGLHPAQWRHFKSNTLLFGLFFSSAIFLLLLAIHASFSKRAKNQPWGRILARASWVSLVGTGLLLAAGVILIIKLDWAGGLVVPFVIGIAWAATITQLLIWYDIFKRRAVRRQVS